MPIAFLFRGFILGGDALFHNSCYKAFLGKPGYNNVANHIGICFTQLTFQVFQQLNLLIRKRNLDFF